MQARACSGPPGQDRPAAGPRLPEPAPLPGRARPPHTDRAPSSPRIPAWPSPAPRQRTSPSATFFAGCVDTIGLNLEEHTARRPQRKPHPRPERPASDRTWPGVEARDAGPVPRGLKCWPHSCLLHPGLAALHPPRPRGLGRSLTGRPPSWPARVHAGHSGGDWDPQTAAAIVLPALRWTHPQRTPQEPPAVDTQQQGSLAGPWAAWPASSRG